MAWTSFGEALLNQYFLLAIQIRKIEEFQTLEDDPYGVLILEIQFSGHFDLAIVSSCS